MCLWFNRSNFFSEVGAQRTRRTSLHASPSSSGLAITSEDDVRRAELEDRPPPTRISRIRNRPNSLQEEPVGFMATRVPEK